VEYFEINNRVFVNVRCGLGREKCWLKPGEYFIIIKWADKIIPVQIHDTRIEKISLERMKVTVYQKDKKPIRLNINFLEREQKREVYEFFIEYSKERNIILEKRSSTLINIHGK
jgi:hypothetical protein